MSTNIDQNEIYKFSKLAHRWWDEHGEFKPLHRINPLRLKWINESISIANKRILDVGCGGGILTESMARLGAQEVVGIDLSEASLAAATAHALSENIANVRYVNTSTEDFSLVEPTSFDIVTCMEMLEHVPDPRAIVFACSKLLKPNGWIFFSTINKNLKSFMHAILGAEYVLNMVPRGTHSYEKFIRPSELISWCRQTDLDLQKMQGLTYSLMTKDFSLCTDASVNYMVALKAPLLAF
jgi:2-polyprenyl-6-hydroxyphenyl methylase / 3-demethylubiquinone-9 3-methyltransferase